MASQEDKGKTSTIDTPYFNETKPFGEIGPDEQKAAGVVSEVKDKVIGRHADKKRVSKGGSANPLKKFKKVQKHISDDASSE